MAVNLISEPLTLSFSKMDVPSPAGRAVEREGGFNTPGGEDSPDGSNVKKEVSLASGK